VRVCLCVCVSVCSLIFGTTFQSLRRSALHTSGFMDDVILAHTPRQLNMAAQLIEVQPTRSLGPGYKRQWTLLSVQILLPHGCDCVNVSSGIGSHTRAFSGPLSRTTKVSPYQKCKTNLDFTEARDSGWRWHQLGHMQVCTSLQTDNHASTPPVSFLQAGCSSCHPTDSVKALKAHRLTWPLNSVCVCVCVMHYVVMQHKNCLKQCLIGAERTGVLWI